MFAICGRAVRHMQRMEAFEAHGADDLALLHGDSSTKSGVSS